MMRPLLGLLLLTAAFPVAAERSPEEKRWQAHARATRIVRDDWGVPHINGRTDADAVFGMIYAQAEDDFPRIERNYLVALGRLAEAEGEGAIWQDLRQRLFIDPARLRADYAAAPADMRRLMDAWADGLNFYLTTHPATRARVLTRFEPWMALSFSEGSIGGDIERVSLSQLQAFYGGEPVAMTDVERGRVFVEPSGSNGIAIAPANTRDGRTLLLINPHTSFFFRSEQHVTSGEGLNAYGAATWGQFFIYQGFNARLGWMHTSSGVDNVDEFAETIVRSGDRISYRYGDDVHDVTVTPVALRYLQANGSLGERRFVTYATHHGPIVRREGAKWIATALMNWPGVALAQSFRRTKARNYTEFAQIAELGANSSNNTIYADADGHIAYLHPQFIPIRSNRFDYTKPVDGSDPATDWQDRHFAFERPQQLDPGVGWIANTNNWPWSMSGPDSPAASRFPAYMDTAGENPRGLHATALLQGRRDWTLDGLIAAAYDSHLPAFPRLIPALTAAHGRLQEGDPLKARLAGPVALLTGWDARWSATSTATSLAVFWGEALWADTADENPPAGLGRYDYMATGTSDRQKLDALASAVARLTANFGGWQVPWGEINRFQRNDGAITQTFSDARPSIPVSFASAQWGSLASFGARRYPGTRRYYGTSGNSFVAAVSFGPGGPVARAVTAGGGSGDPASPHFNDQATRYAAGALRPVYFTPASLRGHVERRYHPGESR